MNPAILAMMGCRATASGVLTSTGTVTTTNLTTTVSLGGESANRYVVIALAWSSGAARYPTGCTIGGVTAALLTGANIGTYAGGAIYAATVPTGTTADVVLTWGSKPSSWVCSTFVSPVALSVVGTQEAANAANGDTVSTTCAAVAGGTVITAGGAGTNVASVTGATPLVTLPVGAATASGTTSGTSQIVTMQAASAVATAGRFRVCTATFGPA